MEITTSQTKTKTDNASRTELEVNRLARPKQESAEDEELYMDRSGDLVARVRRAKDAAQREMESFGDVSEYEVTNIHGQKGESAPVAPEPSQGEQPL
jgi:hypothetical protein